MAEGIIVINPVIKLASSIEDTYLRCLVYADLCGALLRQKKIEQFNEIMSNILEDITSVNDEKQRAEIIGTLLEAIKRIKYEKIDEVLVSILAKSTNVLSQRYLANMYVIATEALTCNEQMDLANEYFLKAFSLVREIKDPGEKALAICTISATITLDKLPLSEEVISNIIATTEEMNAKFKDRALRCMSEILVVTGNIQKAEELAAKIEDLSERDAAYRELAKFMINQANYTHAIQLIERISKDEEKASVLRFWSAKIAEE